MWIKDKDYHFYRCKSCLSVLTHDDEESARKTGKFCQCGGMRYSPTNPTDSEWNLPAIKKYCIDYDLQKPEPEHDAIAQ